MPEALGTNTLPDFSLRPDLPLGARFLDAGLGSYRAAARHVRDLPYGRNSERARYELVLEEARGTCSTKHALLAALAQEHAAPVELRLGIYLMNEGNTPGVGTVLLRHGLRRIPEAHCYLGYRGGQVDLTGAGGGAPRRFVREETIRPDQIGAYKLEAHRVYLGAWALARGLDPALAWRWREECIAALSRRDGATPPYR